MDKKERFGVLSIEIDEHEDFEIRYEGDNLYRLPMMGALDFAKDYLKNQIYKSGGISDAEICRKPKDEYNHPKTESVSKQEAISLYMDAYEKIKDRLTIIAATDDRATYQVPEFIKKL